MYNKFGKMSQSISRRRYSELTTSFKFIRNAQALNGTFFTRLARKILFLVNKMFMLFCSELNKCSVLNNHVLRTVRRVYIKRKSYRRLLCKYVC